jgi:hypothetical protein
MNTIEIVLANLNHLNIGEWKPRLEPAKELLHQYNSSTPEYQEILLEKVIVSLSVLEIDMNCDDYRTAAAALILPRMVLTDVLNKTKQPEQWFLPEGWFGEIGGE